MGYYRPRLSTKTHIYKRGLAKSAKPLFFVPVFFVFLYSYISPMKHILATIAGLITASVTVFLIEQLGFVLFPFPEGAEPTNMEWLKNNANLIPTGAMITVILAHAIGIIIGMNCAARISKTSMIPSFIVSVLMILATAINLVLIPSPIWFILSDSLGVLIASSFGSPLARRLFLIKF